MNSSEFQNLLLSPEQLAYKLTNCKDIEKINPFLLAKKLNIDIYLNYFSEDLYSFYTKSEKENFSSAIINGHIPVQRQRYNMALQIYFHLSGANNIAYYKEHEKTDLIKRAKTFASCYLLPEPLLKKEIGPFLDEDGKIKYDDILFIAEKFGVSFKTTAFRIFYKFNNIKGISTVDELREKVGYHITYRKKRKSKVPDFEMTDLKYIKQMIDYISFLPVEQIKDIMQIKTLRDVIYGDIKLAEQINFNKDEINQIIANYTATGIATIKNSRNSARLSTLQDLVQGQLDAYDFIYSKESQKYATTENSKYILPHLHNLLFNNTNDSDYNPGQYVDENTADRTVGFLFKIPRGSEIEKQKEKVQLMLEDILEKKDYLSTSQYIDKAIEVFFETYTSQLFNDGNSRVSKALLNYLLHLKGIPSSFSVADNIREDYLDAIAELGYDHRVRGEQLARSFDTRVVNKDGKTGKYKCNIYGIETVKYENEEERDFDEDIDTIEYFVTNLFVPEYLQERLKNKLKNQQGNQWEPIREINYKPLQVVIYKAIISSYIDCLKLPDVNLEENKTNELKKKNRG